MPGPSNPQQFAHVEAVASLARELDELRRTVDGLAGVPARVDDLARAVADLADTVTQALTDAAARPGPSPAPSWLTAPADAEVVAGLLDGLCVWLFQVYLRYGDAAGGLPECWLWHPEVVEELLWCQHAWWQAYCGRTASATLAGDWHDRQRPGVVRRIKTYAGSCSRESHQTRAGWSAVPRGAPAVPGVDAYASITAWWAHGRDLPAPEPPLDPGRQRTDTRAAPGHARSEPADPFSADSRWGVRWS